MYDHGAVIRGLKIHSEFLFLLRKYWGKRHLPRLAKPPFSPNEKKRKKVGILIDLRVIEKTQIYNEFDEVERNYWFDFKKSKFLHNIDTFYYSIKFKNDFTCDSKDSNVIWFRKYFEHRYQELEHGNKFDCSLDINIPGLTHSLLLRPFSYAGWFKICLECPEYFDVFFAPTVPHSKDNDKSVTCECVVQLRSYMLWMYGIKRAYEMSYDYMKIIAAHFHLEIDFVQENRIDYCWHTNYLQNPARFFNPDDFYKMRVDRFKDALFHTTKVGSEDYEIDYIALGKRSDKVFIRIYMKSKEVIEKGYKPWFFKVWMLNGLINRYDLYCYEYAFLAHSWRKLDMGRIAFYKEFGRDAYLVKKCDYILSGTMEMSADALKKFADQITPKVNLVVNVEYQTMRKHTKTYELIPFFDNADKLTSKRIYDFLDNRKIICDYLTNKVFRLVEPYNGENDSNKSRRDMCAFWKALRKCQLTDCFVPEDDVSLVRTYSRKLNSQILKERVIKSAVTFGIYTRGLNDSDPFQDCVEALCMMNDNDMEDALRFKNKKLRQFNEDELADTMNIKRQNNLIIINQESGEIYNEYITKDAECQIKERLK